MLLPSLLLFLFVWCCFSLSFFEKRCCFITSSIGLVLLCPFRLRVVFVLPPSPLVGGADVVFLLWVVLPFLLFWRLPQNDFSLRIASSHFRMLESTLIPKFAIPCSMKQTLGWMPVITSITFSTHALLQSAANGLGSTPSRPVAPNSGRLFFHMHPQLQFLRYPSSRVHCVSSG